MFRTYQKKVIALAKWKYDIAADILEEYEQLIAACYVNNFTARRTADTIASDIFK